MIPPIFAHATHQWIRSWWPGVAAALGAVLTWGLGGVEAVAIGGLPIALVALVALGVRADRRHQADLDRAIEICEREEG